MAVDYYVLFPCEVRKQVGDGELLDMEKAKNRAELILETLRGNPGGNWPGGRSVHHAARLKLVGLKR